MGQCDYERYQSRHEFIAQIGLDADFSSLGHNNTPCPSFQVFPDPHTRQHLPFPFGDLVINLLKWHRDVITKTADGGPFRSHSYMSLPWGVLLRY